MSDTNVPKDGDFAAYLDGLANHTRTSLPELSVQASGAKPLDAKPERQTIQQVIGEGQEPTDEFMEEFIALRQAPDLSDDELERQALSAPGDDGDVRTPE
jgi:hypothetical protein